MTSSETTTTPDSPSNPTEANPEPSPRVTAPPLRFRRPNPKNPDGTTIPSTSPDASNGFDPLDDAPAAPGGTRSSAETTSVKFDTSALSEIARRTVLTGSLYVHQLLARTEQEQAEDVWIATDRDQRQIGDPLASLAKRHAGAGAVSPDLADAIAAGIGLVAYLARNAANAWQIRRARRKLAALSPATSHETGEPA